MPEPLHLNNPLAERRLFNARMAICLLLVVLMAAGLIARAAYLQLFQHDQYATLSDENRLRLQPVAPTRPCVPLLPVPSAITWLVTIPFISFSFHWK